MVRISFGAYNTLADVDAAIEAIARVARRRLRASLSFRRRPRRVGSRSRRRLPHAGDGPRALAARARVHIDRIRRDPRQCAKSVPLLGGEDTTPKTV